MKSDFLYLMSKEVVNGANYYTFQYNGEKKRLSDKEANFLVSKFDSKNRNCKIPKGQISLKAYEGTLPFISSNKEYKGVRIFTKEEYRSLCLINSNDKWFYNIFSDNYQRGMSFLKSCNNYILKVDNATIVNEKIGKIETPFGICSIYDFSAGLKTILNILYLLKYYKKDNILVNVNECGDVVLSIIFKLVNNTNISLYLTHDIIDMPDNFIYYVNNEELKDTLDFADYL